MAETRHPRSGGFHASFSAALRDADPNSVPDGLDDHQARRFAVYRNNVHKGLSEALGAAYPVVRSLVGDEFFSAMARVFCLQETRRAASMALYGAGFAEFIDHFPPVSSLPYLGDVARLERAWLEACHAADAAPLGFEALVALGDGLAEARFVAHPAARLIASPYPVADIWRANTGDGDGSLNMAAEPQCVLVTRPELEVQIVRLAPEAAGFAAALLAGESPSSAQGALADGAAAAAFQALITAGAFSTVEQTGS